MIQDQANSFYYDGYHDSKTGARYNPPGNPEFDAQYRDGWEDYIFESASFSRMTEYQLQEYIKQKHETQDYGPEYENATRIYNARFQPE